VPEVYVKNSPGYVGHGVVDGMENPAQVKNGKSDLQFC
jgi:hypothetical protein